MAFTQDGDNGVIGGTIEPQFLDELGLGPELRKRPGALRAIPRDQLRRRFRLIWKIHWKLVSKQFRESVSAKPFPEGRSPASTLSPDYFYHGLVNGLRPLERRFFGAVR